jgi:hypothetical protein
VSMTLEIRIAPTGASACKMQVEPFGVNLTKLTNPAAITLTIGNDSGTTQVAADFR